MPTEDPQPAEPTSEPSRLLAHTAAVLHLALVTVAAFAIVAVPLAWAEWFRWHLVFPLTLGLALALYLLDRRAPFNLRAGTVSTGIALGAIAVASLLSFAHPTQHFTTNRDPGIYATTGLWLDREGAILLDGLSAEFEGIDDVLPHGFGFYDTRDDGKIEPQFAHLTHTMLGAASMVGDEPLLTRTNVLVGALSLVALFVLLQQFAAGWAAAAATSAVAFALPQMYFSRGPYSEPLAQLLVVGGLAVLVSRPNLSRGHGLLAGLLLGAVMGSRIDAVLLLSALVMILTAWWLDPKRPDRRPALWFVGGCGATGTIGIVDLRFFTSQYLTDLWSSFRSAAILGLLLGIAAVVLIAARRTLLPIVAKARGHLATAGVGATLAVSFVALALLFIRPLFHVHGSGSNALIAGLQARQGLEIDGSRTYAEQSTEWMAWYLGWPLVLFAVAGAALLTYRLFTRWSWPEFAAVVALGFPTAVYLYQPSIVPDHLWAMRRFVPTALPLFALLAAVGLAGLGKLLAERAPRQESVTSFALGVLIVVPAMSVSYPYWTFREFRLDTAALSQICEEIGDAAVLFDGAGSLGGQLLPPVAAACGTPSARLAGESFDSAPEIARRFHESGRDLVIISRRDHVQLDLDGISHIASVEYRVQEIERAVARPPVGTEQPIGTVSTVHLYQFKR